MARTTFFLAFLVCWGVPALGLAQFGVPNVRGIQKPTGTSCRTVQTVVEARPDASCKASGQRRYEVDELECSHFVDGHLDAFYTKMEERVQGCAEKERPG